MLGCWFMRNEGYYNRDNSTFYDVADYDRLVLSIYKVQKFNIKLIFCLHHA